VYRGALGRHKAEWNFDKQDSSRWWLCSLIKPVCPGCFPLCVCACVLVRACKAVCTLHACMPPVLTIKYGTIHLKAFICRWLINTIAVVFPYSLTGVRSATHMQVIHVWPVSLYCSLF
jgi:hypothetical protein